MTENKIIKFDAIKDRLVEALKNNEEVKKIGEEVALVEGFFSPTFNAELSSEFFIGGPRIPVIMLIGKESGRVYYFALRAILKDLYNG